MHNMFREEHFAICIMFLAEHFPIFISVPCGTLFTPKGTPADYGLGVSALSKSTNIL